MVFSIWQAATGCNQMACSFIQGQYSAPRLCSFHPDCAVSQRYGVISLVNSPPSTNNIAHALSSIFKHKLNQMGSNRTNNIMGLVVWHLYAWLNCIKVNWNWLQWNGRFNYTRPIFSTQIVKFPNVMELFHWLTHPPPQTT